MIATADIPKLTDKWMGQRVRAVLTGDGPNLKTREEKRSSYRVIIEGTVVGWEYVQGGSDAGLWLSIAGYGRVLESVCQKLTWWRRLFG